MGARRVVASMVGAAVVDGLEMRAAPDDRGQTVKKKKSHGPKLLESILRIAL
jgi:hypothetical protein